MPIITNFCSTIATLAAALLVFSKLGAVAMASEITGHSPTHRGPKA
jgi:hypothetical protein